MFKVLGGVSGVSYGQGDGRGGERRQPCSRF